MSELVEKLINVRNNGSKRQAHIDLANECIQEVISLERQLEEARELVEDAISEIVVSSSDDSEYTVLELYERLEKLKEKDK